MRVAYGARRIIKGDITHIVYFRYDGTFSRKVLLRFVLLTYR